LVHLDSLDLGGHRLINVAAGLLPAMDAIGAQVGTTVAGNLGYAVLRPWRLLLDYHHLRLHLVHPAHAPAGVPFATGHGGGLIQVEVTLNDRGPYRCVLDTGASATALAPGLARDLGLRGEAVEALAVTRPLSAQLTTIRMLGTQATSSETSARPFSRAPDRLGSVTPQALIDWCAGILDAKFGRLA
jgi:hypothetical protein